MSAAAASSSASYMPGAPPGSIANPPPPIATGEMRLRGGPAPPPRLANLSKYKPSRNVLGLETMITAQNFHEFSIHASYGAPQTEFQLEFERLIGPQISRNQVKFSSPTSSTGDLAQRWDALSPTKADTSAGRYGFFHWTMFPVVSTGVTGGTKTPMTYIMAYSSFPLGIRVTGHKADYQVCNNLPTYYMHGEGMVNTKCSVDVALMGPEAGSSVMKDIHMMASLYASLTSSRPANGSYVTFWPYFATDAVKQDASTKLQDGAPITRAADDHKAWQVGGASAGLSLFAAITGMPTMFYTGSLRYIQPNRTMDSRRVLPQPENPGRMSALTIPSSLSSGTGSVAANHLWSADNGGYTPAESISGTDTVMVMGNMITNVTQIPAKVAYVAFYNIWPMIVPNNTTWQRDMTYVLQHQSTKAAIKFWLGLTPGIYTQASADSGVMYAMMPTPIIMAQNTSDAILLSSTVMAVRYQPNWEEVEQNMNPRLLQMMYERANGDYQQQVVLANRVVALRFVTDAQVPASADDVDAIDILYKYLMNKTGNRFSLRGAVIRAAADWGKTLRLRFKVTRKRVEVLRESTNRVLASLKLPLLKKTDAEYVSGRWKIPVIGELIGDPTFAPRYAQKVAAHIAAVKARAALQKARFTAKTPVALQDLTRGHRPMWEGTEGTAQSVLPTSIAPLVKQSDDATVAAAIASDDADSPLLTDVTPQQPRSSQNAVRELAADQDEGYAVQYEGDNISSIPIGNYGGDDGGDGGGDGDNEAGEAQYSSPVERSIESGRGRGMALRGTRSGGVALSGIAGRGREFGAPVGGDVRVQVTPAGRGGGVARTSRAHQDALQQLLSSPEDTAPATIDTSEMSQPAGSRAWEDDLSDPTAQRSRVQAGMVPGDFDDPEFTGGQNVLGKRGRIEFDGDEQPVRQNTASGRFGSNGTDLPRSIHGLASPYAAAGQFGAAGQFEANGQFDRVANAIRRGAAQNAAGQFGAASQFKADGKVKRSAAAQFKADGKVKATKAPVKAKATASGKMTATKKKTKDQEMAELKKKLKAESQRAKAAESNVAQASGAMAQLNKNPLATYFGNS